MAILLNDTHELVLANAFAYASKAQLTCYAGSSACILLAYYQALMCTYCDAENHGWCPLDRACGCSRPWGNCLCV